VSPLCADPQEEVAQSRMKDSVKPEKARPSRLDTANRGGHTRRPNGHPSGRPPDS